MYLPVDKSTWPNAGVMDIHFFSRGPAVIGGNLWCCPSSILEKS